jgi:hypothetical protein
MEITGALICFWEAIALTVAVIRVVSGEGKAEGRRQKAEG